MDSYNSSIFIVMVIASVGLLVDISLNDELGLSAYATSNSIDVTNSISLITLSIQNLANDSYNRGYQDGLMASGNTPNPTSQSSQNNDGFLVNYYDNGNIMNIIDRSNGVFIVRYYESGDFKSHNQDFNDELLKKYSVTGNEESLEIASKYSVVSGGFSAVQDTASSNDTKLCFNESGYQVESSISVVAVVKNDVLKIRGDGIEYDSSFDSQAVISLYPKNDFDGTKDIHLVTVKSNGSYFGFYDVNKVFYDGYVYNGIENIGNIDSLGDYVIELQYDDQCGSAEFDYVR